MKNQLKTKAMFLVRLIYEIAISRKVLYILPLKLHTSVIDKVLH